VASSRIRKSVRYRTTRTETVVGFVALCRCPRGVGTGGTVTEQGLLRLRIHFVGDGDHVQEHLAEIQFGEIVL